MSTADEHESAVRPGRKLPYKQLPDAVIDDAELAPEAKLTYWYLKRIAGYTDDRARVSVSRLAEKMGYSKASKRSARSWLEALEAKGWIDIVRRKADDGKTNLVSDYIVHDFPREGGVGAGEPPGVGAGQHPGWGPGSTQVGAGQPHGSRSSFPRSKNPSPSAASAPDEGPEVDLLGQPVESKAEKNASNIVAAWHEGYATTGVKPPKHRGAQIGAEANRLLRAGNEFDRLIMAARAAGAEGRWSIEAQLTARARNGHRPSRDVQDARAQIALERAARGVDGDF